MRNTPQNTLPSITLIGLPGSGKSTLGQLLSKILDLPLIDSDTCFEHETGRKISEVFAAGQEAEFRSWEKAWLMRLPELPACILSTGGGLPCQPGAMETLNQHSLTIWLNPPLETIWERLQTLQHPMIQTRTQAEFTALAQQRIPFYQQAHWQFQALTTPEALAQEILQRLKAARP